MRLIIFPGRAIHFILSFVILIFQIVSLVLIALIFSHIFVAFFPRHIQLLAVDFKQTKASASTNP